MNPVKESEITMASVEKFSAGAVRNQLRHNRREIEHSGNPDIDPSRQGQDYVLSPDRGMSDYDYFLQRKSELYCYNRDDVKVMAGWVVTAPQDLDPERYDDFFCATYDFLANRYSEENVVQAIVHDDEGGQPHLHFCFVPVVEDPKHEQGYKICANDVLDRRELRNFHPDLQRYLNEHGLEDARVMTGVTKRQGGNRTVAQLKAEREQEYQQEVERPALYFGESSGSELRF
jgi:plasmid recombination enzyme